MTLDRFGRQQLFFVHIMKTGGTTLRQQIRARFDDHEVFPSRTLDGDMHMANSSIAYLASLSIERQRRIRAFMGHFPYMAVRLLRVQPQTITVLRHPVERVVSHLKHLRRYSDAHKGLPLGEIYADPVLHPSVLRCHQAKIFAFKESDRPSTYREILAIDDERLALAKANLDEIDVVGFVDHFEELLGAIEVRFGWQMNKAERHRAGGPTDELPVGFLDQIASDNAAELDFYDYARRTRLQSRG